MNCVKYSHPEAKRSITFGRSILGATILLAIGTTVHASTPAISPNPIDFGNQGIGMSTPLNATLTNGTHGKIKIVSVSLSPAQFSYSGLPLPVTLQPGQSMIGTVTFTPTAAQTFNGTLTFTRANGSTITASLRGVGVQPVTAPSIVTQPLSQTATAEQTARFSVTASGSAPLSYQWRKNGTAINGATSASYTTPATTSSDNGAQFTVVVSNSVGTVTSNAAILTVTPPPVSVSPTSFSFGSVAVGTISAQLDVQVANTGTLGVSVSTLATAALFAIAQNNCAASGTWNGVIVPGTHCDIFVTFAPTAAGSSSGSLSITVAGSIYSVALTGTGNASGAPSISGQPTSQTVTAGQTATFSVTASGSAPLSYQWQKNGSAITGATSAVYHTPATINSDNGAQFTVVVSNSVGTVTSNIATLTVNPAASSGPTLPTLPQATVDLTMPTQTGTTWNVPAGDANTLQNDINSAGCGDTIVLVAGSTYTGNFNIPNKNCTGWILIESNATSGLPSGVRVSTGANPPSAATRANLATIVSNVADTPVLTFQTAAHNWRLIGLEITQAAGTHNYSLIETENGVTQVSQLVNHIIIDRCYVHGTSSGAVRRGISFQVAYGGIVDSDIREFHDQTASPGLGSDSQAVAVWSGAGPFLYQNNLLSAASENTMFGGADPSITNLNPSDITIVGNYYWKDMTWRGQGMIVKNIFEMKNAQRALIDGNVFENNWGDAQQGIAVLFTVRNQDGGCLLCVDQDFTFTHNLVRHAAGGIETTGADSPPPSGGGYSLPDARILVQNNVFTDINGGTYGGGGWCIQALSGGGNGLVAHDLVFDHDDCFPDNAHMYFGDNSPIQTNIQWTNWIGDTGAYGCNGNSSAGNCSATFANWTMNLTYGAIVFNGSNGAPAPAGATFSDLATIQFTNYAGGNYQLLSTSQFRNAGTDGHDIGVWDWTTFNTETTDALAGIYP